MVQDTASSIGSQPAVTRKRSVANASVICQGDDEDKNNNHNNPNNNYMNNMDGDNESFTSCAEDMAKEAVEGAAAAAAAEATTLNHNSNSNSTSSSMDDSASTSISLIHVETSKALTSSSSVAAAATAASSPNQRTAAANAQRHFANYVLIHDDCDGDNSAIEKSEHQRCCHLSRHKTITDHTPAPSATTPATATEAAVSNEATNRSQPRQVNYNRMSLQERLERVKTFTTVTFVDSFDDYSIENSSSSSSSSPSASSSSNTLAHNNSHSPDRNNASPSNNNKNNSGGATKSKTLESFELNEQLAAIAVTGIDTAVATPDTGGGILDADYSPMIMLPSPSRLQLSDDAFIFDASPIHSRNAAAMAMAAACDAQNNNARNMLASKPPLNVATLAQHVSLAYT